ncbi:MAG: hypothetical protein U9R75_00010 [Candidatus Thermoplasmatota archaeon]|nr:hypothetical protein [Candidatus Thermoplasmatota archaeon]
MAIRKKRPSGQTSRATHWDPASGEFGASSPFLAPKKRHGRTGIGA